MVHARLILLVLALAASGCSINTVVANRMGDALASSGSGFSSDDDPELIGAAVPFSLKLMESVLAETPNHRGLLLALTQGFVQYSYAFVEMPADEIEDKNLQAAYAQRERARRLYLRARNYGLRGLETTIRESARRSWAIPRARPGRRRGRAAALLVRRRLGRRDLAFEG
jgi:hypothetical protein